MENHKVVFEKHDTQFGGIYNSRVFSNFENLWGTDFYEDFIPKTIEFLKSFHPEDTELHEDDFKTAAHDLLLGYSLIRWQGGKAAEWVNFLEKQYDDSLYHKQKQDYRRYVESRQNRTDLEKGED